MRQLHRAQHHPRPISISSSPFLPQAFYILPFPGSKGRVYLLYTGQHYDPLVGAASENTAVADEVRVFPVGDTSSDSMVLDCARLHAAVAAAKASQRRVKKIKCGGCGALLEDATAFQEHCGEIEHDDDFAYDCEEVDVVEEGDDAVPEGRIDLASPAVVTYYQVPTSPFCTLHPAPIKVAGRVWPTAEHFLAAMQVGQTPHIWTFWGSRHIGLWRLFTPPHPRIFRCLFLSPMMLPQYTSGGFEEPVAGAADVAVAEAITAASAEDLRTAAGAFQVLLSNKS